MRLIPAVFFLTVGTGFAQLAVRPAVTGGLRVEGSRLVDGAGRVILLQGTQAPMDLGLDYGGTMFSTIRQRWNMNMVRLPVSVDRSEREPGYLAHVTELVRRANQSELFVVLAAHEDGAAMPGPRTAAFWRKWAAHFKNSPLVAFDLFDEWRIAGRDWSIWRGGMQALVDAVRSTGARQVLLAMAFEDEPLLAGFHDRWFLDDANIIYEVCPSNRFHATDTARERSFGFLASRVPLMASGWDPEFAANSEECRSVPRTPAGAAALVRSHLNYFDAHGISWSASSFTPGKLIFSMNSMEPTEIYKDIECGAPDNPVQGAGLEVQLHQWSMTRENLISVSLGAGAIEIARGGMAVGYALITKTPEAAETWPLPDTLGGVSVRITDSAGVVRLAPLLYAGLGSINYLIDPDTALGMAQVELVRPGSAEVQPEGCIIVTDAAPGLFSATMNARGPAVGVAGRAGEAERVMFACDSVLQCRTIPVPVAADGSTRIRLFGTGFRNATSSMRASIGGRHINILEAGPQPEVSYNDQLVLQVGAELAGLGEEDLVFWAGERISNVVRVHLR